MMRYILNTIVVFIVLAISISVKAQITITTETNPLNLARKILGSGVTILNPQYTGGTVSAGIFKAVPGSFPLDSGIVLTTGRAKSIPGSAGVDGPASLNPSFPSNTPGDAALSSYSGKGTLDACILEFDFIPQGDSIFVRYVFASDEYPTYVCTNFNDVFAFFISGPGFFPPGSVRNIALVPNISSSVAVTINTVNSGIPGPGGNIAECQQPIGSGSPFPQYYVDNQNGTTMTYNGGTVVLTASAKVTPCAVYHIKLAIADGSLSGTDRILDSGVFLEANSFRSKKEINTSTDGPYTDPENNNRPTLIEACKTGQITLTRNPEVTGAFTLTSSFANYPGTATPLVDFTTDMPTTITFAANENQKTFNFTAPADALNEGLEKIVARFAKGTCTTVFVDSAILYIRDSLIYRSRFDTSLCTIAPIDISAHAPEPSVTNSYAWNNGGSTQTITVNQPGTYIATHTYSQRCQNIDTFIIVSNDPTVVINQTDPQFICPGETISLSTTSTANSIVWNTGATTNSINVSAAGDYWVTGEKQGCTKADTITIVAKPLPVANLGADTAICASGNIVLDATYPGATYVWNTGATTPSISVNTAGEYYVSSTLNGCTAKDTINVIVSPIPAVNLGVDTALCENGAIQLNAGYTGATNEWNTGATTSSITVSAAGTYSVINTLNGCIAKDTINIAITPAPVVELGADTSICSYNTIQLDATNAGATYVWNTGATSSSITVNTTGQYSVIASLNGCSTKDTIDVTVTPAPIVNLGNDTSICENRSIQLNAAYTGATHQWNTGAVTSSITVSTAGTYSVLNTLNGCIARDTITIAVTPVPVVELGNDTTICSYSNLTLDVTNAGASYLWNTGATSSSITVNTAGEYSVIVSLNGCSVRDTIDVTVTPAPVVNLGRDTAICENLTIQLNAAFTGASHQWNTGATSSSITVSTAGTYSVLNTLNGCTATDTINIIVTPVPVIDLGNDTSICEYDTIVLSVNYAGATYVWNTGATTSSIAVSDSGMYSVITSLNGCSDTDSIALAYKTMPVANAGVDLLIASTTTAQLNATQHANNAAYLWSPANSLSDPSLPNPVASPVTATEYTVMVTSTDGCISADKVMVRITFPLVIPNAFSPNGDNINDLWRIGNIEFYPTSKVFVYNRYGQQVFFTEGYGNPWDGKSKGKPVQPSTYYYIIDIGDGRKTTGWVLLLR
jgi:gliding motility-associated-like protein